LKQWIRAKLDLFRWAAVPSHPPFEAPRNPPFGGWCERRDARTFRLERVLTPGVKQMLKRVFPLLKRPDVEFTLECASFILFCAAALYWVAQF
jgi:hypothetical protein